MNQPLAVIMEVSKAIYQSIAIAAHPNCQVLSRCIMELPIRKLIAKLSPSLVSQELGYRDAGTLLAELFISIMVAET